MAPWHLVSHSARELCTSYAGFEVIWPGTPYVHKTGPELVVCLQPLLPSAGVTGGNHHTCLLRLMKGSFSFLHTSLCLCLSLYLSFLSLSLSLSPPSLPLSPHLLTLPHFILLLACMSWHCMCVVSTEARRGHEIHWTGVTDCCKQTCGGLESKI